MRMDSFVKVSIPFVAIVLLALAALVATLAVNSAPAILRYGLNLITTSRWSPSEEVYGLLPALMGTLYVSALATGLVALIVPGVVALAWEYAPASLRGLLRGLMFYGTALPTVVFGLWGLDYVSPLLRSIRVPGVCENASPTGQSILTGAVVLALMNAPFASLILYEAYRFVPFTYREALFSLGATGYERFRVLWGLIKGAFLGALLLTFGKSVGETTAVSLVVGNSFNIPLCPLEPGITVSSLIVNYVAEASLYSYMLSALFSAALVMLLVNVLFVAVGLWLARKAGGWR